MKNKRSPSILKSFFSFILAVAVGLSVVACKSGKTDIAATMHGTASQADVAADVETPSEPDASSEAQPESAKAEVSENTEKKTTSTPQKTVPGVTGVVVKTPTKATSTTAAVKPVYQIQYTFNDVLKQLSPYTVATRLQKLRTYFPNGTYWNHVGISISGLDRLEYCMITTKTKCNHKNGYANSCNHYIGISKKFFKYSDNYQCLAFASLISDLLYGPNTPITKHKDFNKIKVGDQIRFVTAAHSVVVIGKAKDSITVVECNYDTTACKIVWGRTISKRYFSTCGEFFVLSRVSSVKSDPKPEEKKEEATSSTASSSSSSAATSSSEANSTVSENVSSVDSSETSSAESSETETSSETDSSDVGESGWE